VTRLVTSARMREIEAEAVERGATWPGLMERAGETVAREIRERFSEHRQGVLVLAGPGNNGGDALIVAGHLAGAGWHVTVATWSRSDDALSRRLRSADVHLLAIQSAGRADFTAALNRSTLVVDGLLGTGLQRDIEGDLSAIIDEVNASGLPVVAIDIPSGVDADTGLVRGTAIRARATVALGLLKFGHALEPGKSHSGQIISGDIGLSANKTQAATDGELLAAEAIAPLLPGRPQDSHKGTYGKAMIVAGSINYVGSAALAAWGALRSGAGLVTLGIPGDLLGMLSAKVTEATFLPLPSDLGVLASPAADKLRAGLEGYDALLIGCGIGKEKETAQFLRKLIERADAAQKNTPPRSIGFAIRPTTESSEPDKGSAATLPKLVLDADALNILSEWEGWQEKLPSGSVLTPHPREMARLLGSEVEKVEEDRVGVARTAAAEWNQIVVLKGASTVIAAPGGEVFVSPFSNAALATAGTGDVLAGLIVGLMAQGLEPIDASRAGVYLHGLAGEMLAEEYGSSGGLAGELPSLIAKAAKRLRGRQPAQGTGD
jgi:ADP-dependent NAD(P)H-hydrate dehydratase / NAD(P)H-hydrate epimerase